MNTDGLVRRINKLELNKRSTDIYLIAELEAVRRRIERGEQKEKIIWKDRISAHEARLSGHLSSSERKLTQLLLGAAKRMDALSR